MGLVFLVTLYCAARIGAGIRAILFNIPGTAGAAATPQDGYPMAKQGKRQQALAISFVASALGVLLTTINALPAMPLLARVGFYMHLVQMIVVMLFGISLIASSAAQDMLKGLIAGFFGLMIGAVGTDVVYATPAAPSGFWHFTTCAAHPGAGGPLCYVRGVHYHRKRAIITHDAEPKDPNMHDTFDGVRIALSRWWHIAWRRMGSDWYGMADSRHWSGRMGGKWSTMRRNSPRPAHGRRTWGWMKLTCSKD